MEKTKIHLDTFPRPQMLPNHHLDQYALKLCLFFCRSLPNNPSDVLTEFLVVFELNHFLYCGGQQVQLPLFLNKFSPNPGLLLHIEKCIYLEKLKE